MGKEGVVRLFYVPEHIHHEPIAHVIGGIQETHPESVSRLPTIFSHFGEHFKEKLIVINSTREASNDEILLCHDKEVIEFLADAYEILQKQTSKYSELVPGCFPNFTKNPVIPNKNLDVCAVAGLYCYDTCSPIGKFTIRCARQAAAASIDAALQLDLQTDSVQVSYALLRPPGHHAGKKYYGGFCYFNNAALSAQVLLNRLKGTPSLPEKPRVAIIDLDYHHGNGTQDIFNESDEIVYFSTHASPEFDYPYYSGTKEEIGEGPGKGFNFNYPFPPSATFEEHYKPAVRDIISILQTPEYKCHAIVVSLGFDALLNDPVGSFSLLPENYGYFGTLIASLNLPTLIIQEGGYNPDRNFLAQSAVSFSEPFVQ